MMIKRPVKYELKYARKRSKKAISPVISAVILTSILLVILVTSTFVANNILELKVQSTEFEQAKTNMHLLDEIVSEAGVKYGSGSYVQFNLRSGALNIVKGEDKLRVFINDSLEPVIELQALSIVYRAGSLVSSPPTTLRGNGSLIVEETAASLGYLRVETEQGVQLKLDYNRIKVMNTGIITVNETKRNLLEIVFFNVKSGSIGGSGILSVKAQNKGISTQSYIYNSGTLAISVKIGSEERSYIYVGTEPQTVVVVIESIIEIST